MADQNTLVFFVVFHVFLNFFVVRINGTVSSRNFNKHVQTVTLELNDNKIDLALLRNKREISERKFGTDSGTEKNVLSSSIFEIPDKLHSRAIVHWSGDNGKVLFVLTQQKDYGFVIDSTLWRSEDYGTTFTKKELPGFAIVEYIFSSPVNRKQLILTDIANKKVYCTVDEGIIWTESDIPFEPDNILLHPTESQWIIGYSVLDLGLYTSGDFGKTWTLLHEGVSHRFYWAVAGVDKNNLTVHMEIQDLHMLGPSRYLACVAPSCEDVTSEKIGDIDPFSLIVRDEYIFVTKSTLRSSDLLVSYNRGPFRKAYFPTNLHPTDFHFVDTSEHQVFIAADHKEMVVNLYLSDVTGQFFVPTLKDVVSTIEDPWLDVDLYQVKGVQGTFIANQNVDLKNGKVIEKTYISFDKGSTWSLIDVPTDQKTSCNTETNCHLHLHMRYSLLKFGIPDIVSEEEAPGLIIAHGYIGEEVAKEAHVFISRDGGLSWNKTPFDGMHKVKILDQGGAIIAIEHNKTKLTNVVHFSIDEGLTWESYEFSKNPMIVDGVLTEPGISTLIVSVFGRLEDKVTRQMVKLNFSSLLTRQCQEADYESWIPVNKVNNKNCILGQTVEYQRRKQSSNCYNGPDYQRLQTKSLCLCTPDDFQCDYGYEPEDINRNICMEATWYDDSKIDHHCVEGELHIKSQGYRKIASDKCVGGVDQSGKYKLLNVSCPVYRPQGLSLKIEHDTVATGSPVIFKLAQAKGSSHSTIYTWDFGDGSSPLILMGLDKSASRSYTFSKAGTYKVTVVARNSVGMETCTKTVKAEDPITDLNIQLPRGAQENSPTQIIINILSKTHSPDFGLVHYVWNFGDYFTPNGTESHLTWSNSEFYSYKRTGKYNLTLKAVNSVSSYTEHYLLEVHKNITTLQLLFSSNVDHFNTQSLLWRISFGSIVCMNLAELLYLDRNRINVYILKQKPTVAEVTILPSYNEGITIQQAVLELQDKVRTGEIEFQWLPNEDPVIVTSVQVVEDWHDKTVTLPSISPTTTTTSQPNITIVTIEQKDRQTSPILIAVPLTILIFILLLVIGYCIWKNRKRDGKPFTRYSLMRNRNHHGDEDTSCAEQDFDDEDLTIEDYDIHDGDSHIVVNAGFQPSLQFMSLGTTSSNNIDSVPNC